MNNNSISGQIPPELSRLPSLIHFLLDNNNLSGYLPPQFSELPNLLILQLDNNHFDGTTIPATYGNMSKLLKLSLRNCSLQGPIPDLSRIPYLGFLCSPSRISGAARPCRYLSQILLAHQALPGDHLVLISAHQASPVAFSTSLGIVGDPSVLALIVPPAIRSGSQCFYAAKLRRWFLDLLRTLRFFLVSDLLANHDLIGSLGILDSCRSLSAHLVSVTTSVTWWLSDRGIKQCTHCGCTNHNVDGDNSSSLPVDQVLISKTEYDSLLQRANASSSLLIASGNTCLHSSSSPYWVIDSGASDHMTGNSSLLSHTSSPCSPSFVTVANGTKTHVQGKDSAFQQFLKSRGIIHQTSCVRTPQQNGIAERKNGPILAIARALMLQMNVPKLFWADAVLTAAYLLNRMPSRILKGKSPFEIFFPGKNPFSVPPRVFGCVSFVHNHSPNRDKLDPCAHKCIFLGYSCTQKGYWYYSPSLRKHFVSAEVTFFEDISYYSPKGRQLQESMLSAPVIPTHDVPLVPPPPPVEFSLPFPPSTSTSEDSPLPQSTSDLDLLIAIRKGKRTCTEYPISNCVSFDYLSSSFKTFSLSLSSLVPKSYRKALSHPGWRKAMEEEMHALELNHTWDLIPKPAGTSIVGCHWVFTVKQNLDSTVDRLKARLVAKGFTQTYGLDYTETFSLVAKLNSIHIIISLAANLDWPLHQLDVKNAFLHGDLTETVYMTQPPGFESKGECVCHLKKSIYGLKQSPRAWFDKFSKTMVSHGMTRSQADHSVFFKKTRTGIVILVVYVDDIVITGSDKEGIQILINHLSSSFLTKDLVSIVSQFMTNPRVPHMNAVIRILKYLKNAPGRGLFYRSSGHLRIEGGNLVTWRSKKQSVVARSSAEAEYRAMAHTTCELTWLRTVLQEFGLLTQGPTPLYCDNQAAIHIASNPVFHERTKYIEVDCHFVRSKVESKDIITPFVPSGSQLADIFTKALPKNAIDSICSKLGVIDIYSPA
uniref:Integrase catalytic domain-containing protein n=1 Tax=Fagus sylvatica TaxID=28930 RepID=A0A2N9F645_FAGSY